MEVAIDCDGPLCDTFGPFVAWHNAKYGTHTKITDLKQHDLSPHFDTNYEELKHRFHRFFEEQGHLLLPSISAQDSVKELKKYFGLHVVTNRPTHFTEYTKQWVAQHYPSLFKSINITNAEGISGTAPKDKFDVCKELNAYALIDDSLENIISCAKKADTTGYRLRLILLDAPWNRTSEELPRNAVRVPDWQNAIRESFYRGHD